MPFAGTRVILECTSAVIIAALPALMAIAAVRTRVGRFRALSAGLAAMALVVIGNLYRLVIDTFAGSRPGPAGGFDWSDVWLGSFVTVLALAAAVVLHLRMLSAADS